jgi:hypothetical protein
MALAQRFNGTVNVAITAQNRADHWETFEPGQEITASTALTWPAVAGQYLVVNSASAVTLTPPNDAGIPLGYGIKGLNRGAGAIGFAGTGIVANAILPATVDQYSAFELRRITGGWVRVA